MIGKFFVLALCGVAFSRATVAFQGFALSAGNDLEETYAEEDAVRKLTNETQKRVEEVEKKLTSTSEDFDEMRKLKEKILRQDLYELSTKMSARTSDAMLFMVIGAKPFSTFECVMAAEEEATRKLHAIVDKVKQSLKQIQDKTLSQVRVFESSMLYPRLYVSDLAVRKIAELNRTSDANQRKRIVKEVENNTDYINLILYHVKDRVKLLTEKLNSDFLNSIYQNRSNMNKAVQDGIEKIDKIHPEEFKRGMKFPKTMQTAFPTGIKKINFDG